MCRVVWPATARNAFAASGNVLKPHALRVVQRSSRSRALHRFLCLCFAYVGPQGFGSCCEQLTLYLCRARSCRALVSCLVEEQLEHRQAHQRRRAGPHQAVRRVGGVARGAGAEGLRQRPALRPARARRPSATTARPRPATTTSSTKLIPPAPRAFRMPPGGLGSVDAPRRGVNPRVKRGQESRRLWPDWACDDRRTN